MIIILLIFFQFYISNFVLSNFNSGHNKPFGTGLSENVEIYSGFLNPKDFFKNFINVSKPLLMKQAAIHFPAFNLWDDEYFLNLDLSIYEKTSVFVEKHKKENRTLETFNMEFKDFIHSYNDSNIYMVDSLPLFLNKDIFLPWSLQCKIVEENIYQVLMWFSSGGTSSVVHSDDMENINCLIRGEKTFVLVDPIKHKDKIQLKKHGSYSDMDVDKVDFVVYSNMSTVDYIVANMVPGDCLYLPKLWIHQVRSFNRNIAINIWFNIPRTKHMSGSNKWEIDWENDCRSLPNPPKTFSDIVLLGLGNAFKYKEDNIRQFDEFLDFHNSTVDDLLKRIKQIYRDVDDEIMGRSINHIKYVIKEIIDEVDHNKNSIIDGEDIRNATKMNFERMSNYVKYLKIFLTSLAIDDNESTNVKKNKRRQSSRNDGDL